MAFDSENVQSQSQFTILLIFQFLSTFSNQNCYVAYNSPISPKRVTESNIELKFIKKSSHNSRTGPCLGPTTAALVFFLFFFNFE